MHYPRPEGVIAALRHIDPIFLETPMRRSDALDQALDASIVFKDETANPIRSFKGRGAGHFIAGLSATTPLVCASAGNFGQGLAWAARRRELPITVFAAHNAVRCKLDAMRALGADVRLQGDDFDAAKRAARAHAERKGYCYVEDGAHAAIAEGAGTLALELTEAGEHPDAILVPLGNGALAAGVGAWMKHARPATRIVAVGAAGAPAMARAVETGRIAETAHVDTIADGIAVRVPIPYAVDAVRRVTDQVLLVEDSAIRAAMALLDKHLGLIVEPAGAAGLAAIVADPAPWRGQRIAVPLCGGNLDNPTA
ncbi:threonine ammonia-lyase [Sphingomonas cavernae]|uniref:Pyridoxal-phosphate dependent enzyme n=1 Tax=Sphingomonas cavernae TaxID=2320861 RepID=A0A418WKL6_9SPHN|nr:pyridoxal-phosphate dependent enzyme [Sphingomonas cavernae]RJF90482.1 pyridoxal-phosphate dependent enzyme [Sphingomonas cavernae]